MQYLLIFRFNLYYNTGDIICFNNIRVLHGRQGFHVQAGEHRLLLGYYLDWDELRSRRRVLEKTLQAK